MAKYLAKALIKRSEEGMDLLYLKLWLSPWVQRVLTVVPIEKKFGALKCRTMVSRSPKLN